MEFWDAARSKDFVVAGSGPLEGMAAHDERPVEAANSQSKILDHLKAWRDAPPHGFLDVVPLVEDQCELHQGAQATAGAGSA